MKKKKGLVLSIATLLAATTGFYLVWRKKNTRNDTPPKNAPQLPIHNPGDQSEFPAAPVDNRDLG